MHNQGDLDDQKQNDFDEFKLDLQQIKYEIVNDMKKTREDNTRNMFIINNGIQVLAEELLQNKINLNKDKEVRNGAHLLASIEHEKSIIKLKDFMNSNQILVKSSSFLNDNLDMKQNLTNTNGNNNQSDLATNKSKNSANDFIDNLNKNKLSTKVNFDLNDNKFFASSLTRILEESNSERSDLHSDLTSSTKTPM